MCPLFEGGLERRRGGGGVEGWDRIERGGQEGRRWVEGDRRGWGGDEDQEGKIFETGGDDIDTGGEDFDKEGDDINTGEDEF
jgi:hypothetical protein